MQEEKEKRGPIEKSDKGWPVNPFGVIALLVFAAIVIFLIIRPLITQKTTIIQPEQVNSPGGKIQAPQAGEIIRTNSLSIELSIDNPQNVDKVQFWVKTYADGKWQMIGEVSKEPYTLNWQVPQNFENKAIAITSHILQKDGAIIKDPGGWKEGIIILSTNP
jgi:hypothetical protein